MGLSTSWTTERAKMGLLWGDEETKPGYLPLGPYLYFTCDEVCPGWYRMPELKDVHNTGFTFQKEGLER